jgi:predicted CxxxxCH...CXXCH cytochrome family protein
MSRFPWMFGWILAAGCPDLGGPADSADTDTPSDTDPDGPDTADRYHPVGYDEATAHGPDTLLGPEDCRECHGEDLAGGTSGVDCDSCHQPEWRTNCVYCHGGTDGDTDGAPPRDLDGRTDSLTFDPHRAHVDADDHKAVACATCHGTLPEDVLTPGHTFDDTQGEAEIAPTGLGQGLLYDGSGGCSNVYCHGNGKGTRGATDEDDDATTCASCHPSLAQEHGRHRDEACADCHGPASGSNAIDDPSKHVDGAVDVQATGLSVSRSGSDFTCTGFCHNRIHFFEGW